MASAFRPVHELAAEIAARRLSPVDLVDEYLARIERLEPRLHAFVSVNATRARLAAEGADKAIRAGHAVGPLHGIPIGSKTWWRSRARSRWAARQPGITALRHALQRSCAS